MQQVCYVHGAEAFSDYEAFLESLRTREIRNLLEERPRRWTDTLRQDLGSSYEVYMPKMPNVENAKYQEWKIWFERHFEFLRDDVTLVGWSQGGYFLCKFLSENTTPFTIRALFLLAAPFETDDFGGEDGGDFAYDTSKLANVATQTPAIHIFHSEGDFVVPYEHALKLQAALPQAMLHTFMDRNHFLQPELPELIDVIKKMA